MKGLFELGLAEEIVEENYKIIKPYPITALRHSLNEKIENLKVLSSGLDKVERALEINKNNDQLASLNVRYYKKQSGGRQLFWNTLKAKSTVMVYSEFGRSRFVGKKFYQDFVAESAARNIKEKVLINPTKRALGLIQRDTGTSLARTNPDNIRTLDEKSLVIRGETFIYDNIYAQVYLDKGEINGFEIESPYFVETQVSIFKTLWKLANSYL